MGRRAVLLDRDNTLISDPGFISDPDQVRLLPASAVAVRKLNRAGFAVVVVSNQSGVARGLFTEDQLTRIHERLRELMLEQGARIDAIYYCPYLNGPEAKIERYRRQSDLRKPAPGMLLQAASDLELSLADSWMVGDSDRDVMAGARAGCRTVLLDHDGGGIVDGSHKPDFVAGSLLEAVEFVIHQQQSKRPNPGASRSGNRKESAGDSGITVSRGDRSDVVALLEEIRDIVLRRERRSRQEDFSIARLLGTLMQILAIVTACWGAVALFRGATDVATTRLVLAGFLQLTTLTAMVADRR